LSFNILLNPIFKDFIMNKYVLYRIKGISHNQRSEHGKITFDLFSVKLSGYNKHFGNKYMPIDIYDYFATHFLLYKEEYENKELIPIACVRSIRYEDCFKNDIEFLPITRVKNSNKRLLSTIQNEIKKDKRISYDSGLTIVSDLLVFKEIYQVLNYMMGIMLNYHIENKDKMFLITAVEKTKTDKLFKKIGFSELIDNASYNLHGWSNEGKFFIFNYTNGNQESKKIILDSKKIWDEHLNIKKDRI